MFNEICERPLSFTSTISIVRHRAHSICSFNKNTAVKKQFDPLTLVVRALLVVILIIIVITSYSPSCLGQETAKGPFGLRVKLPPAHLFTTHGGGFILFL